MSLDFVRRLPLFADLPEADLRELYQRAEPMALAAGEWLMREGESGDALFVILEGGIEITKRSGGQEVALALREPGEVIGEMALLEHAPRSASGRAAQDTRLLKIDSNAFRQVLMTSPTAALALLRTANMRLRSTEALLRQSEKMASLGTLAAGLAHELNNPAAAVQSSSRQLRQALAEWQNLAGQLDGPAFDVGQRKTVQDLQTEIARRIAEPAKLDPLTRSDLESELQDWLETKGVDRAWELAPTLITFGFDVPTLKGLTGNLSPGHFLAIVTRWLAASCLLYALLDEVRLGAERIAEIVKTVKAYAYLDQAPIQLVDVPEGLENTLIILRHKLKAGVSVVRDYAPDLPRVEAYASELNQTWTNLIDNAVDAMQGRGRLTLRTYRHEHNVVVEIADDGPGIPAEIQSRIFDPFFTTKPPGSGTGLGLHIVYNSVVHRHHGQIHLTSQPGATTFQIVLPIQLSRGQP
ncbi:MAG: cyclic nucleotide-binding domain-containing protein [Chloroflexi bacterium]|nr:cyclic nucleotide-binding domain-containing protein [Chloroflexota bacterium]